MNQIASGKLPLLFWILAIADILSIYSGFSVLHFCIKPVLIPVLIAWLKFNSENTWSRNVLIAGLFFSFLGDVLLLFEDRHPIFFILGLASFLTTHILYIVFFLGHKPVTAALLRKQPLIFLFVLCYCLGLIWLLFPYLGELKLPVIIYGIAICTMLMCSLLIFTNVNKPSNLLYVSGAILFVLSDSILAINKFYQPFIPANVLIMLTYCAAQFLIVKGYLYRR